MRRKDREVIDKKEIEKIILQCKTCHVAMVDDGIPYVVPLSHGYQLFEDGILELYFHSAVEGRKLEILRNNNKVCFEMACEGELIHGETPCSYGYCFSSVIGYGEVIFIEDTDEKCKALSAMFKHQTGKDTAFGSSHTENVCIFKIVSNDYTGKMKSRPEESSNA